MAEQSEYIEQPEFAEEETKKPESVESILDRWLTGNKSAKNYKKLKTLILDLGIEKLDKEGFSRVKDKIEELAPTINPNYLKDYRSAYYNLNTGFLGNPVDTEMSDRNRVAQHMKREEDVKKEVIVQTSEELRQKWVLIPEKTKKQLNDKLILDLFLNYPLLRSDVFRVKIANYDENTGTYLKDNTIYVMQSMKNNDVIEPLVLNETTISLIEKLKPFESDYLITMTCSAENRTKNGNATHRLNDISKKYLGVKMGIDDFRKAYIADSKKKLSHLPEKQRNHELVKVAKQMNHSFQTQQLYYTENVASSSNQSEVEIVSNHSDESDYTEQEEPEPEEKEETNDIKEEQKEAKEQLYIKDIVITFGNLKVSISELKYEKL